MVGYPQSSTLVRRQVHYRMQFVFMPRIKLVYRFYSQTHNNCTMEMRFCDIKKNFIVLRITGTLLKVSLRWERKFSS